MKYAITERFYNKTDTKNNGTWDYVAIAMHSTSDDYSIHAYYK